MNETTERSRGDRDRLGTYIKDWVYGGIDGAVTTFAVVAGVAGAALSVDIILILGFANLLADGFSMAAGNFSSSRTEIEQYDRLLNQVRHRIRTDPESQREAIRRAFAAKGFAGKNLDALVETISANEDGWAGTILVEEYGQAPTQRRPLVAAANTYAAFLVCGIVPLLPYIVGLGFVASSIVTAAVFFAIGSLRSLWTDTIWWRSGGSTLAVGGAAAAIAYLIGYLLKLVVGDVAG